MNWTKPDPYELVSGDYRIVRLLDDAPYLLIFLGSRIGRYQTIAEAQKGAEMHARRAA